MCFSATASLATGSVLLAAGAASISKAPKRSYLMLASTPLLFSIQQFFEGAIWLCLLGDGPAACSEVPILVFVLTGQSFWPVWVPLSVLMIEKNAIRKKILIGLSLTGFILSSYFLYYTLTYGVHAQITDHHISYNFKYPASYISKMRWIYLLPTVFSYLASSFKKVQVLGLLFFLALIVTDHFFNNSIFSVWCFFAAAISIYIFFIMRLFQRS